MSGGRKIDDHSFWGGNKSKASVFPEGVHTKNESSAEGEGSLAMYEDTTEKIKMSQEKAKGKIRKHPREEFQRN